MTLFRYLRTTRHLKPVQIYTRLRFRLWRPSPDTRPAPALRGTVAKFVGTVRRSTSLVGATRFRFLNEEREVRTAQDWNHPSCAKLWLYHLHYFDDLNSEGADGRLDWHRAWLQRWVKENPPGYGIGWEPYPCSLRIVNWIKWALRGNTLPSEALHSLAVQSRWLERRIEWHLLGNHLFANAKALVFAGLFFSGDEARRWLDKGLKLIEREIPEQILGDGGHFERSPMYQAIVLEDALDLINLCRAYGLKVPGTWLAQINCMRHWLAAMIHPDGDIAFFNDATLEGAPTRNQLEAYARRLEFPAVEEGDKERVVHLRDSGYLRLAVGPAVLLADVAPIGPDYLPGHAHADTLSFELSLYGRRLLVNSGTSTYGIGRERDRQRGTAAHNTVIVDDTDSSEVWAGFRVGRRARVFDVEVDDGAAVTARAAHDGYRHLSGRPTHRREWRLDERELVVTDRIGGTEQHRIEVAFHVPPHVTVASSARCNYQLKDRLTGKKVSLGISGPVTCDLLENTYHPQFGVSQNSQRMLASYHGLLPVEIRTTIRW